MPDCVNRVPHADYARFDAALNINQRPNAINGLNFRPFEASAAGSCVFNPNVPDLPQLFEPDKEVMVCADAADLAEKHVRISKGASLKATTARAGLRRTLAEHTFVHRARCILRHLGL